MNMKICPKCGELLPINNFYKNKNNKDGFTYKCKKCITEYNTNWSKSNNYKYQKNYYKNNRENVLERNKKYHQTDKGKQAAKRGQDKYRRSVKAHNTRHKRNNITHDFTDEQWQEKLEETNGICPMCKEFIGLDKLTLDHIIPVSKAPHRAIYTIDDVQPLCKACNSEKNTKMQIGKNLYSMPKIIKKLKNNYNLENKILKTDRQLYSKVVDYLENNKPTFTEEDVVLLDSLI